MWRAGESWSAGVRGGESPTLSPARPLISVVWGAGTVCVCECVCVCLSRLATSLALFGGLGKGVGSVDRGEEGGGWLMVGRYLCRICIVYTSPLAGPCRAFTGYMYVGAKGYCHSHTVVHLSYLITYVHIL